MQVPAAAQVAASCLPTWPVVKPAWKAAWTPALSGRCSLFGSRRQESI